MIVRITGLGSVRMKRLVRELLYGAIRSAIQIGAGVVGWFLPVDLMFMTYHMHTMFVPLFFVFMVTIALESIRARRFKQLYAERMLLTKEERFMKYYLPGIILAIIVFVVLFPLGFLTGMSFDEPFYVLVVAIGLWPEVWLAHRRYPTH
jgi:hypothetical protein